MGVKRQSNYRGFYYEGRNSGEKLLYERLVQFSTCACLSELAKYRTPEPLEKQRKWRPRKNKALMVMQEILVNETASAVAFVMFSEDHSCKK